MRQVCKLCGGTSGGCAHLSVWRGGTAAAAATDAAANIVSRRRLRFTCHKRARALKVQSRRAPQVRNIPPQHTTPQ